MHAPVSLTLVESLHFSKDSAAAVPCTLFYDLCKAKTDRTLFMQKNLCKTISTTLCVKVLHPGTTSSQVLLKGSVK